MKVYVIKGDPRPIGVTKSGTCQKIWDIKKSLKEITIMDLEGQHQSDTLLKGKLHLSVTFFMPHRKSLTTMRKKTKTGEYHASKPRLCDLVKFIEQISKGIIYEAEGIISSISSKKVYDSKPRVEFSFKELQ